MQIEMKTKLDEKNNTHYTHTKKNESAAIKCSIEIYMFILNEKKNTLTDLMRTECVCLFMT